MINWDPIYKQLLSPQCKQCPDPYFAPYHDALPHVGCCSHSPAFGLFEIYKMVKAGDQTFFWEQIYHHEQSEVQELTITVNAHVHPLFKEVASKHSLSPQEEEDLKLSFSVCSFFVRGKGCGLHPDYKNKICRGFICTAIEDQLDNQQRHDLAHRAREIRQEVETFEQQHQAYIKQKGWSFQTHMEDILDYLMTVNKT